MRASADASHSKAYLVDIRVGTACGTPLSCVVDTGSSNVAVDLKGRRTCLSTESRECYVSASATPPVLGGCRAAGAPSSIAPITVEYAGGSHWSAVVIEDGFQLAGDPPGTGGGGGVQTAALGGITLPNATFAVITESAGLDGFVCIMGLARAGGAIGGKSGMKVFLPRICSRTLMGCFVPLRGWGGAPHQ